MTPTQKTFAVVTSATVLLVMIELVRRRRLREEYALLWLATGTAMVALCVGYPLLEWITRAIGAVLPTTTLFLFGLLFLLAISVHFSVVLSRLTLQVRRMAQEMAILAAERDALRAAAGGGGPQPESPSGGGAARTRP